MLNLLLHNFSLISGHINNQQFFDAALELRIIRKITTPAVLKGKSKKERKLVNRNAHKEIAFMLDSDLLGVLLPGLGMFEMLPPPRKRKGPDPAMSSGTTSSTPSSGKPASETVQPILNNLPVDISPGVVSHPSGSRSESAQNRANPTSLDNAKNAEEIREARPSESLSRNDASTLETTRRSLQEVSDQHAIALPFANMHYSHRQLATNWRCICRLYMCGMKRKDD